MQFLALGNPLIGVDYQTYQSNPELSLVGGI